MPFCSNCGTKLTTTARFCPICGCQISNLPHKENERGVTSGYYKNIGIISIIAFRKKKSVLTLNPSENYSYNLIYNTFSGSFNSALCDNEGTILETDKEPWWYYVFFFLIPIIGFIYSISMYKKKPAAAKDALILSFIGFIIAIILNIVKQM